MRMGMVMGQVSQRHQRLGRLIKVMAVVVGNTQVAIPQDLLVVQV
jgi:hypothetical protein